MNRLWLIIQREYFSIVGKKSFIIMTILMPFIIVLIGAIPAAIAYFNDNSGEAETYTVIDETGKNYAAAITDIEGYHFTQLAGDSTAKPREFFDKAGGSISGVIIIPANVISDNQITIYSENTISPGLKSHINSCINDTLTAVKIASYGVPDLDKIISDAHVDVSVNSVRWDGEGNEEQSSTEVATIVGMLLSLLTYMFVLMYGAMIMNSVIEEKTNRIVEVVVSSCKPFQLMMGKIIGVGLVGLTQFIIWVVLVMGLGTLFSLIFGISTSPQMLPDPQAMQAITQQASEDSMSGIMQSILSVNYTYVLSCFVIYFIGGYLLYASLFAGFGSAVDEASEASQFTTPVIMLMIIALYAGIACVENPNGQMAVWCSMIPFTSPVVMMVRLPYDVPVWQLLLSIVLLYVTATLFVWISARIYRTGILLYGKKTSYRDIIRWIK